MTTPLKARRTGAAITALGEFETGDALPIAHGGTGATDAAAARTALGLGTAATQDATTFDPAGSASGARSTHELAYDHALIATALQSETDPVFSAWDRSTGISITESQIRDFGDYEPADATILKSAAIGVTVCSQTDPRLSDARTPTAHKSSHATGQADALSPADIGAATAGHDHAGIYDPSGTASSAVSAHESAYTHALIATALQPAAIDDESTATDALWSAAKISGELGNVSAALDALNGESV